MAQARAAGVATKSNFRLTASSEKKSFLKKRVFVEPDSRGSGESKERRIYITTQKKNGHYFPGKKRVENSDPCSSWYASRVLKEEQLAASGFACFAQQVFNLSFCMNRPKAWNYVLCIASEAFLHYASNKTAVS